MQYRSFFVCVCVCLYYRTLSEEEANDRFDDVDENNDDAVTWKEYVKETYDMDSDDDPNVKKSILDDQEANVPQLMADDRIVFETADLDNDGVLNRKEFVLFISPEEHPIMLPILLNQTLRDKDKDGDGKVSFQEFLGDQARDHGKEWLVAEKDRFDNDYDKDGDGVLNGNEILSWVIPSNE